MVIQELPDHEQEVPYLSHPRLVLLVSLASLLEDGEEMGPEGWVGVRKSDEPVAQSPDVCAHAVCGI